MSRIVVIGGGIGGLSAAVALRQFGFEVEVYEQAGPQSSRSAGTWVPPNAMRLLERLGCADAVREQGATIEQVAVDREDERRVGRIDFEAIRRLTGFGNVAMRRSTLRGILLEELPEGTVEFGQECRRVERRNGAVRAVFESGESVRADVLVGADGLKSYVRGDTFGMVRLRYGGRVWFRGLADVSLPTRRRREWREIWGGRARFGYSNVDGDRVYWFAPVVEPHPEDAQWDRARIRATYADFPEPVGELIESTPDEELERVEPHDVRPLETWSAGRVILVGDAAHAPLPNLGQGAAQAIEDGWALAACLDRWDEPEVAFERFEEVRIPRANRVIRQARFLGRIAHLDSSVAAGARDWLLEVVPRGLQRLEADWLYDVDDLIALVK